MTISEIVFNILETANLGFPVWAGTAAGNAAVEDGLINFFQLPGIGANFADGTVVTSYQIDLWHKDLYICEQLKDDAVKVFMGVAGVFDGKALIFNIESDGGVLIEDSTQINHYFFTIGIKYNKR